MEERERKAREEINKSINNPTLICEEIYMKVLQLGKARRMLKIQAEKKAKAKAEYEKKRALTILELAEKDHTVEWEGKKISNLPVSIISKVADGIVSDYKFKMEYEDSIYSYLKVTSENLQAELNGLQSINKYMIETPGTKGAGVNDRKR